MGLSFVVQHIKGIKKFQVHLFWVSSLLNWKWDIFFNQSDKLSVVLLVNFHRWDVGFIILSSLIEQRLSDYILKGITYANNRLIHLTFHQITIKLCGVAWKILQLQDRSWYVRWKKSSCQTRCYPAFKVHFHAMSLVFLCKLTFQS